MLLEALEKVILLDPTLENPFFESLRILKGNVVDQKPTPVHMYWRCFDTLNIQPLEAVNFLAVLSRSGTRLDKLPGRKDLYPRYTLIRNRAVVHPLY